MMAWRTLYVLTLVALAVANYEHQPSRLHFQQKDNELTNTAPKKESTRYQLNSDDAERYWRRKLSEDRQRHHSLHDGAKSVPVESTEVSSDSNVYSVPQLSEPVKPSVEVPVIVEVTKAPEPITAESSNTYSVPEETTEAPVVEEPAADVTEAPEPSTSESSNTYAVPEETTEAPVVEEPVAEVTKAPEPITTESSNTYSVPEETTEAPVVEEPAAEVTKAPEPITTESSNTYSVPEETTEAPVVEEPAADVIEEDAEETVEPKAVYEVYKPSDDLQDDEAEQTEERPEPIAFYSSYVPAASDDEPETVEESTTAAPVVEEPAADVTEAPEAVEEPISTVAAQTETSKYILNEEAARKYWEERIAEMKATTTAPASDVPKATEVISTEATEVTSTEAAETTTTEKIEVPYETSTSAGSYGNMGYGQLVLDAAEEIEKEIAEIISDDLVHSDETTQAPEQVEISSEAPVESLEVSSESPKVEHEHATEGRPQKHLFIHHPIHPRDRHRFNIRRHPRFHN